jgi:hypothetical protein
VDALSAPAPEPMLQETPAFVESFATVAVKPFIPLPFSDAVAGLTLTLIEGGGGVVPVLLQPDRKAKVDNPQKTKPQ